MLLLALHVLVGGHSIVVAVDGGGGYISILGWSHTHRPWNSILVAGDANPPHQPMNSYSF